MLLVLPILALTAAGPLRASTLAPLAGAGPLRPGAVAELLVTLRAPILALGCCPAAVALAGAVGDLLGGEVSATRMIMEASKASRWKVLFAL